MIFLDPKEDSGLKFAQELLHDSITRGARIDRIAKGNKIEKLILGIGQEHTVRRGAFSGFQVRRIGRVQAWIFHVCFWILSHWNVVSFGQEGYSSDGTGNLDARLNEEFLESIRRKFKGTGSADAYCSILSREWRRALKGGDQRELDRTTASLNALTLLQAQDNRVTVFPIEQVGVHSPIGEGLSRIHDAIRQLESSTPYTEARRKNGRGLTRDEYDAVIRRNELIKQHNALLTHPERDRALFREVVERAERDERVVFLLGQGHRKGMLRLAKEYLPDGMLFLWITPPMLRSWSIWWVLLCILILCATTAVMLLL